MPSSHCSQRINNSRRQAGNALLLVIGAVAVISAIAVAYLSTVSSHNNVLAARARLIAARNATDAVTTLAEWRLLQESPIDAGREFNFVCLSGDYRMAIRMTPESDRLNVNLASLDALADEFRDAGVSPQRADAIAAAIIVNRGGAGARGKHRKELKIIDELLLLPDLTAQEYKKIAPHISILSPRAGSIASFSTTRGRDSLFRIEVGADLEGKTLFRRLAVVEIDLLRSPSIAVRVWRRDFNGDSGLQNLAAGLRTGRDCEEIILSDSIAIERQF